MRLSYLNVQQNVAPSTQEKERASSPEPLFPSPPHYTEYKILTSYIEDSPTDSSFRHCCFMKSEWKTSQRGNMK